MYLKYLFLIFCGFVAFATCNFTFSELNEDPNFIRNIFFQNIAKLPTHIPTKCELQLAYIYKYWKTPKVFPIIDSWGKIPSGIMTGHMYAIGNFMECINYDKSFPTPIGQVQGQYCRAMVPMNPSTNEIQESHEVLHRMDTRQSRALKIYIKSGICIPKSCKSDDIEKLLPFKVESCKVKESIPFKALDYVAISISSIIGFLLVIGTAYDYLCKGPNKNPYLIAFSVPSNAEKLFHVSTGKNKNSINCLNGIRVLSMIWVIFGHSFASQFLIPQINFIDVIPWTREFYSLFVHNAFISVDSFFFISGLLVSWIGMKEVEKRKGRLNPLLMYIHRYIRLTPMVAFVLLYVMSLIRFFGNGPLYDDFMTQVSLKCENNWFWTLLYVQNYAADQICIPQTWYLAIDFQLFLFAPLILYLFYRWGAKTFIGIAIMIGLSVGCIFGTFYKYDITGALVINGKHSDDRMGRYYLYTHTRYSIWLVGICFGYILYKTKDKDVKIPWYAQIIGWICTAGIIYGVVMAPHTTVHGYKMNQSALTAAMFESFGKIGWGFMMSWVVFACYHGYGGVVDSFLSNPLWQPFARMSFTMYLAHIAIMDVLDGNAQTSEYFSNFQSILKFWSHFGITILVSIALVLAVESPIIGLEKILLSGKSKKPQPSNKANQANNEAFVADENQEKNSRDFA